MSYFKTDPDFDENGDLSWCYGYQLKNNISQQFVAYLNLPS